MTATTEDLRYMAAAIRLSRRHLGLTGTNPSVATLIVRDGAIVGQGITAPGGRPHAETIALAQAGERAQGATAYVTLEPCAHHGRTPPCAGALVAAGVARVVGAAADPDERVSGRGYAILQRAGIAVVREVMAAEAAREMAGYLNRTLRKRPQVILKLAVSADGSLGARGAGQVAITGEVARAQSHLLRASCNAILIGVGTAIADDPLLTCRLPGLASRSPARVILDANARLPLSGRLASSAREVPLWIAALAGAPRDRTAALVAAGCEMLAAEDDAGRVALPELLDDLAARGVQRLLVEGGAETARAFLDQDLADRLVVFASPKRIAGADRVASPIGPEETPRGFALARTDVFGDDVCRQFERIAGAG